MLKRWRPHHSAMVTEHLTRLIRRGAGPRCYDTRLAEVTNCLPVYETMSGSILLSATGDLLRSATEIAAPTMHVPEGPGSPVSAKPAPG
jgi:hypothetical protein